MLHHAHFINASVIRTESEGTWSWAQRVYELRMYMQAIPANNGALSDNDKVILDRLISFGTIISILLHVSSISIVVANLYL